jgi:hypothetical protein
LIQSFGGWGPRINAIDPIIWGMGAAHQRD